MMLNPDYFQLSSKKAKEFRQKIEDDILIAYKDKNYETLISSLTISNAFPMQDTLFADVYTNQLNTQLNRRIYLYKKFIKMFLEKNDLVIYVKNYEYNKDNDSWRFILNIYKDKELEKVLKRKTKI